MSKPGRKPSGALVTVTSDEAGTVVASEKFPRRQYHAAYYSAAINRMGELTTFWGVGYTATVKDYYDTEIWSDQ